MTADTARILTRTAQAARNAGAAALEAQSEAVRLYRALGDPLRLAHAVRHLGDIHQDAGRHDAAGPCYEEAMAIYRAHADAAEPLDVANALRSMALHHAHIGDPVGARALWQEVRDRYAALDDLFERLSGKRENPGVAEAKRHLAALEA